MPKIRKRVKEVSNNDYSNPDYKSKSGSLTKNYKSILDFEDYQQGTIPIQNNTVGNAFQNVYEYYNDNDSVVFKNNAVLNLNLRLDQILVEKLNSKDNKIFHTPNTFNEITNNTLTNTISDTLKSKYYDDVFYKNNFSIENTPYKEDKTETIFQISDGSFETTSSFIDSLEKNYNLSNQTSIEIELDFTNSGDAYLQNNKVYLGNDGSGNLQNPTSKVSFGKFGTPLEEKIFKTYNTPTAYFDFKNNRWDYILNNTTNFEAYPPITNYQTTEVGQKNYIDLMSSSNIAFSPSYNSDSSVFNVSTPCFNSKFPIGNQWFGEENNLLNMKNYINRDFIIEKIIFECNEVESIARKNNYVYDDSTGMSNYSSNNIDYVSNAFNFFILKQKNNINADSYFECSGLDNAKSHKNEIYFTKGAGDNPVDLTTNTSIINDYLGGELAYRGNNSNTFSGSNLNNDVNERSFMTQASRRELITSSCFYISTPNNNKLTNQLDINNHIDSYIVTENSDDIYKKFSLKLESNCRTFNKDNIHNFHTITEHSDAIPAYMYSNNYLGGKDLQGNSSSNFINNQNSKIATTTEHINKTINTLEKTSYNSPVIISPKDNLIFGINSYTNGNILPYMFILKNKVKVTLIGRHILDNKKIDTKISDNYLTSKSTRKTIESEISNKYEISAIDELNGSYIDKVYIDNEINNVNSDNILERSSIGLVSSKKQGTFSNTVSHYSNNEVIYDSLLPSIFKYIENSNYDFDDISIVSTSTDRSIVLNNSTVTNEQDKDKWMKSFPYHSDYIDLYDKRNEKIFETINQYNNFKVSLSNNNFIDQTRLYQYINIIDHTYPTLSKSFGNQSIKEDVFQNNMNIYKVYKNVRGYIETNNLSIENNLDFLSQGKSKSIEIPTNIYADIVVWKNTESITDENYNIYGGNYINDYYYAQIIKIKGDTFFDLPTDEFTSSYNFPSDEDSLEKNNKFRLVFYSQEANTINNESYKYDDNSILNHNPNKVIARIITETADLNEFNSYIDSSNKEWDKIIQPSSPWRESNKYFYLEKQRNIVIKRIETIMKSSKNTPDFLERQQNGIDFNFGSNNNYGSSETDFTGIQQAAFKTNLLDSNKNYSHGDNYIIEAVKSDGTWDSGSTSTFIFTDQTSNWTQNELDLGYKGTSAGSYILIGSNHVNSLQNLKNAINNASYLNTYGLLYAINGSENPVSSKCFSLHGISIHQKYKVDTSNHTFPTITESSVFIPSSVVSFSNFSKDDYFFYRYEGAKDLSFSDYDDEIETVNEVNKLFFGYSNKKGTSYKRHPLERLDGWKYGVFSGIRSYIKHNFNWRKFGQFSDRVNGSLNTAVFVEDGDIRWPIIKTFYDSNFYPIDTETADSSILSSMNSYNKDPYSRHVKPFIES